MATMLVRHEPTSASLVRHRLAADLAGSGVEAEVRDEIVIVASELVGNAIRHSPAGTGSLLVAWEIEPDGVLLRVTDSGRRLPTARAAGTDEPGGRGLTIVHALTDRWGVEPTADGKCVWAHVPLNRVPA